MCTEIIDRAVSGLDGCFPAVGGGGGAVSVEVCFEGGDTAEALGLEKVEKGEEVRVIAAVCVRKRGESWGI